MRAVRVLAAAVLGWLAGMAFGPAFGGFPPPGAVTLAVTVTAITGMSIALLSLTRVRSAPAMLSSFGAAAVLVVATVASGAGADLTRGPAQLLTGALPAEPTGPPLAAAAVVTGWAVLLGGLIAGFGRGGVAPALPPLACLLAALSLGASLAPLPGWYPVLFVAMILTLLVTGSSGRFSIRRLGGIGATVAVALIATVFIGPAALGMYSRAPADARSLVAPPVQPRNGVSPLQQYPALRSGEIPLKLAVTSSRPRDRLRLATLTRFDGTFWTVTADYRRAGNHLPPPPSEGDQVRVTQDVRIEAGQEYLGWLVTAGRPTWTSASRMAVDESIGDLAVPKGTNPPASYSASSVVNVVDLAHLRAAEPLAAPTRLASPLPAEIQNHVRQVTGAETTASRQLIALYRAFKMNGGFRYDVGKNAKGGHGYFQIRDLLKSKLGTSEQYASAFAVMAAHLGIDARVVMGFAPRSRGGSVSVVENRDVDAWVEVRFAGLGWVTIDPSPRDKRVAGQAQSGERPADGAFTALANGQGNPAQDPIAPKPAPTRSTQAEEGHLALLVTAVAVPIILAVLLLAVPTTKAIRRFRRRHDRSERQATLGAWWETRDRLRESGYRIGPGATSGEVAQMAATIPHVRALATLIDNAAYAPGPLAPDLPAKAWRTAHEIRTQLRAATPLHHRIRATFNPRTLNRGS